MALHFDPRVLDNWAWLSHKAGLDGVTAGPKWIQKKWIPEEHHRRLTAYKFLAAYVVNNARAVLTDIDEDKRIEQREYGDAGLIVSKVVSGVLGDGITLVVDDMQQALADPPSLNDQPVEPGEDASDIERALFDAVAEVWETEKVEQIERWKQDRAGLTRLRTGEDWLQWWVAVEHVHAKIAEAEAEYCVPLGDVIYGLAYSTDKARPVLTLYPPDAYMPELTDDTDFPSKVHLVWQEPVDEDATPETELVRRITYELVDIDVRPDLEWGTFPYASEPAKQQCLMTDVTFDLGEYSAQRWDNEGGNILNWDPSLGTVNVNENGEDLIEFPLGIDFIPIVHVPNTPSTVDHFGTSSLARVLRLLDDIVSTDTDVQRAVALAGSPVIALSGANVDPNKPIDVYPGKVFAGGPDFKMSHVDMSPSVDVLDRTKDSLLERLAVNVQIPESMLGRLKETRQFPSGVALRMSFQSFIQLIDTLRMPRQTKFRMLLRFAQRLHVANGGTVADGQGAESIVDAHFEFGEFIPADVETTTAVVTSLLSAHGISRAVAATMLQEVGFPIDDIQEEVFAINREDTTGAKEAADATGSEQVAADLLGVELEQTRLPQPAALPQVLLP